MNHLTDISIAPHGIIVFGARPGMGLTRTVLKLSNYFAESENVVFISYQDYERKLIQYCEQLTFKKQDSLYLDTQFEFFDIYHRYLHSLKGIIDKINPKTIVIDDLDAMLGENYDLDMSLRDELITGLEELVRQTGIRLILNVVISAKTDLRGGAHFPMLRDFTWCRKLVHSASEIYTLYRPEYYGMTLDENGNTLLGQMEISKIKDSNCRETKYLIYCDKENIIPYK